MTVSVSPRLVHALLPGPDAARRPVAVAPCTPISPYELLAPPQPRPDETGEILEPNLLLAPLHDHAILVLAALAGARRGQLPASVLVSVQDGPGAAGGDEGDVLRASEALRGALVALVRRALVPLYRATQ